jgi:CheY-like chemotaxis protein
MTTPEKFMRDLRDALNHLADFDALRHSPLLELFGVPLRFDAPANLQQLLVEAIETLEPPDSTPAQAHAWRVYECLSCRYVQQLSPQEVADQLGIGERQLRREQQVAIEALAQSLWRRYGLEAKADAPAVSRPAPPGATASPVDGELDWLRETQPDTSAELGQALPTAAALVRPLADRYRVELALDALPALPALAVHPVALNQILAGLLSVAIRRVAGGRLSLGAGVDQHAVTVELQGQPAGSTLAPASAEDTAGLALARQLSEISGGSLVLEEAGARLTARVRLPGVEQLAVLVLDDNVDTLQLLQRYLAGTRYSFYGTQDPDQLLKQILRTPPAAILLDVMMPKLDGWQMLAHLRQHPATRRTPIIICTILPQEELALSLGASALVRKPVSRRALLSALDAAVAPETGSS